MEPRIVNGDLASIEQFPHSVYILMACLGETWVCGGSILTQDLVLTAAHCFSRTCYEDLKVNVFVGNTDIRKMKFTREVAFYMVHRKFNATSSEHDIGMGRLQTAISLGNTTKRVIVQRGSPTTNLAQVAGWGMFDEEKFLTNERLRWLPQKIGCGELCKQFSIHPGMICIENDIKSRPALGDSGCALMVNYTEQIGLVSFRHPGMKQLVVYTNVSYYYNWIQLVAVQLSCTEINVTRVH